MPSLRMSVTVGRRVHRAAIRIRSTGDRQGAAFVAIVLTYPDGHRQRLDNPAEGGYGAHDTTLSELDGLPRGVYTCTVYAVPYTTSDTLFLANRVTTNRRFPDGDMVEKNVAASATFVIP